MSRVITVGAAQLGPIQKAESRSSAVERMLVLMAKAHDKGCDLIVYPELALTTFFPRWYTQDQDEIDAWFETSMPSNETLSSHQSMRIILPILHIEDLAISSPA